MDSELDNHHAKARRRTRANRAGTAPKTKAKATETLTPNEAAALEEIVWELTAPHTLEEIAERLGTTHWTVLRIEQRALETMRSFVDDDWQDGLREQPRLHTRLFECGPSDGRTKSKIRDGNDK